MKKKWIGIFILIILIIVLVYPRVVRRASLSPPAAGVSSDNSIFSIFGLPEDSCPTFLGCNGQSCSLTWHWDDGVTLECPGSCGRILGICGCDTGAIFQYEWTDQENGKEACKQRTYLERHGCTVSGCSVENIGEQGMV